MVVTGILFSMVFHIGTKEAKGCIRPREANTGKISLCSAKSSLAVPQCSCTVSSTKAAHIHRSSVLVLLENNGE